MEDFLAEWGEAGTLPQSLEDARRARDDKDEIVRFLAF